jgi:hypothetical protein
MNFHTQFPTKEVVGFYGVPKRGVIENGGTEE